MKGLLNHLSLTLKLNFRSKQAIIYGYVVPIFFLFALGSVFPSNPKMQGDMGRLLTVTILGGACFGMPTTMVAERERGVWRRYRLLPTATGGIILSAMIARFLILLSAAVMQIVLAHFFYKTAYPQHPYQMFVAFTFVCLAFLGLGLVIAMVADNVPAVQALGQAIFLPLIIIGGVGVKLDSLPVWAEHVAAFLPGRYAVQALQVCHYTKNNVGLSAAYISFDFLALTVIGLAGLIAGAKMFRWDIGQKLSGSSRIWVAMTVVAWACIGVTAEVSGRLRSDKPTNEVAENQEKDKQKERDKGEGKPKDESKPPVIRGKPTDNPFRKLSTAPTGTSGTIGPLQGGATKIVLGVVRLASYAKAVMDQRDEARFAPPATAASRPTAQDH